MNLNEQQRLAVEHGNGPLLILAGAGSGKTRVLTERIVNLIRKRICHPSEILAVTFTNKAAAEMRTRVERTIGPAAREIWLNTFHSACLKMLRRSGSSMGLSSNFVIFDDSDQMALVKKVLIELNISDRLVTPRGALEKISRAKDSLISADEYPQRDFFQEKIAAIYKRYDEELRRNGAADFGDLIMLTVKLFKKSPDVLAHYQARFKHILVDEYQDTNHSQYELVRMLAATHQNICVVGDPDQSIYAWRGADISNILEFERDFSGATVIKLEQNYRSTKNILEASDAVIENNGNRKPKKLWTEKPDGEKINIIETSNEREEAKQMALEIKRLVHENISLNDMAIFYRTNAQSRVFEDELRKEGIPYIIFGGIRFYDRAEIKNVIAYLRLAQNPNEDVSLKRVINIPARGIGKTTVEKLTAFASEAGMPMFEFIDTRLGLADLNSGTKQKLAKFTTLIKNLNQMKDLPLPQVVTETVNKIRYVEELLAERTEEANERIANIDELINAVNEAVKSTPELTLSDFLDQVALISDIDSYNEGEDVLSLMTLHLAKGLEFPYVFIVGLEEGVLPHVRSLDETDELEEERRLFYVGMTRAKEKLYISHANERMFRGNNNYNVPSRFLEEIPEKFVERISFVHRETFHFKKKRHNEFDGGTDYDDFSQITYEDQEIAPAPSGFILRDQHIADQGSQVKGFQVGQRVRHPSFGEGIIRKAEGSPGQEKLIVQFKSGELKKLLAQYAKLIAL